MKGAIELQSTITVPKNGRSNLDKLKTYINLPSKQKFSAASVNLVFSSILILKTFLIPDFTFNWNEHSLTTQDKAY